MSSQKSALRDPQMPEGMTFVLDRAEIFNLLVHSSLTECEAVMSFKDNKQKYAGVLTELPRYSDNLRVDLGEPSQLKSFVDAERIARGSGHPECLVLVYSKRQYMIGFHCKLRNIEGPLAVFEFPSRVFKMQRRKTLRWVLTSAYEVEAEMEFPVPDAPLEGTQDPGATEAEVRRIKISHRVTDVSPGGASFQVATREEADQFKPGLELKNFNFILQGQRYQSNCVVRGVLPLPKNFHLKGFRVGVEFLGLDPVYEERLERYVLIQSAYSMI